MASAINSQIITLYESDNMTIEDIAIGLQLEKEQVELALAQGSVKYRKDVKENPELFSKSTLELARMKMEECLQAETEDGRPDYHVIYRASKFVINEAKGRHDIKAVQNLHINVGSLTMQVKNAKEALKRAKEKVIDIPMEAKQLLEQAS